MDIKNLVKVAKKISKKTKKLSIIIFFDIIICGFKYGAGYYDYQEFEFYNLTKEERKTYLTRTKNNEIVKNFNNKDFIYKFKQKDVFNKLFRNYLKRDYMLLNKNNFKEFQKFIDKHNPIIVKPLNGEGGVDVEKYEITDDCNVQALFNTLLIRKQLLVEECIIQHDKISALYPDAVNSLRLFTFFDGKSVYILNSVFKIGNGGVTDNFSGGSMYTFISDKGKVICPAIDKDDNYYEYHPITNEKIIDFEVPYYREACTLVKKCAKVVKEVAYVGWDVAISNKGPVIIEGNCYPGVFQMKPSFQEKNEGLIPKYQKYMHLDL